MKKWRDTTKPWELCSAERQRDLREIWSTGVLWYKLDAAQRIVHDQIIKSWESAPTSADRTFVLDIGRRFGKTTIMLVLALRIAFANPGKRIPFGAATKEMVKEIINPCLEGIIADCPPEIRPEWQESKRTWLCHNGAKIRMVGCDLRVNDLRGPGTIAWFLDEAAFIKRLDYVLRSILMPMMLTEPKALGVMGSTPPDTPGHPWSTSIIPEHKATGRYAHRTIEDNPRISDVQREAFIAKAGGRTSTRCRREYFAEHVIEEERAIVPEFQAVKAMVVAEVETPAYYDSYVSMDPGHIDLWAVLFAYYDFTLAHLVVQDEFVVRRTPTSELAGGIRMKERELWAGRPPVMRISDTALQTICDLENDHGLTFVPTAKDDKRAALNRMRLWMAEGRIWINPKCKTLIAHLEAGIWRKSGKDYERVEQDEGTVGDQPALGHFDCIDALVYLVRNVQEHRNPFPALAPGVNRYSHHIPEMKGANSLRAMFGRLRRGRDR